MEEYQLISLKECPRCGSCALEHLKTHSYCAECNYDSAVDGGQNFYIAIPDWAIRCIKEKVTDIETIAKRAIA